MRRLRGLCEAPRWRAAARCPPRRRLRLHPPACVKPGTVLPSCHLAILSSCCRMTTTNVKLGYRTTAIQALRGADLSNKIAVVTGGNAGIGVETVRALATAGADVVIACRNTEAGRRVVAELQPGVKVGPEQQAGMPLQVATDSSTCISTKHPTILLIPTLPCPRPRCFQGKLSVQALDLADLASVQAAGAALASSLPRLDFLVLNAGVMAVPKSQTKDGFEMQVWGGGVGGDGEGGEAWGPGSRSMLTRGAPCTPTVWRQPPGPLCAGAAAAAADDEDGTCMRAGFVACKISQAPCVRRPTLPSLLLTPAMQGGPGRVVAVSSSAHGWGSIGDNPGDGRKFYGRGWGR